MNYVFTLDSSLALLKLMIRIWICITENFYIFIMRVWIIHLFWISVWYYQLKFKMLLSVLSIYSSSIGLFSVRICKLQPIDKTWPTTWICKSGFNETWLCIFFMCCLCYHISFCAKGKIWVIIICGHCAGNIYNLILYPL